MARDSQSTKEEFRPINFRLSARNRFKRLEKRTGLRRDELINRLLDLGERELAGTTHAPSVGVRAAG